MKDSQKHANKLVSGWFAWVLFLIAGLLVLLVIGIAIEPYGWIAILAMIVFVLAMIFDGINTITHWIHNVANDDSE